MSTENPQPSDQKNSSGEVDDEQPSNPENSTSEADDGLRDAYQTKLEAHRRDGYQCLNCRATFDEEPSQLDADHIVQQGAGGSSLHGNIASLCRDCHEAKHGEREIAPTIRFMSTGDMSDDEFRWFRHFWDEIFPALTEAAVGQRVEPLVNIDDNTPWQGRHIPMGTVRYFEERLAEQDDVEYAALGIHHFM
jgi:hypothetical protein